jgi:CCR4-NOT transcription complex subunit 7/8
MRTERPPSRSALGNSTCYTTYSKSTKNFHSIFNRNDKYVSESINLLKDAGIEFKNLTEFGIDPIAFGDLLTSSGLVLNDEIKWITFHGSFDFAYLLKNLLCTDLPNTMDQFMDLIRQYFPNIYDLKIIVAEMNDLKNGSLSKLAMDLDIRRTGSQHQAGSDAH